MRRAAALILMMLLFAAPAFAEQAQGLVDRLDLGALTDWTREQDETRGIDAVELIRGLVRGDEVFDPDRMIDTLRDMAAAPLREGARRMVRLAAPALLWAVLGGIWHGGSLRVADLVCALTVGSELTSIYTECVSRAGAALKSVGELCQSLYPVLGALMAAAGKGMGAGMFSPAAALAGTFTATVLKEWVLGLTGIAAVLTVAGNLPGGPKLEGLASLSRKTCAFVLGGTMTVYAAVMGVQGILARGYDGASIQTARFAVGSLLPVVGGEVADSLEALAASAGLVKNAVGVAGLVLLMWACAGPVIHLAVMSFAVKLAAALTQIVSDGDLQRMMTRFSETLSLLLAAVATGSVLVLMLIGAALALFGG